MKEMKGNIQEIRIETLKTFAPIIRFDRQPGRDGEDMLKYMAMWPSCGIDVTHLGPFSIIFMPVWT